jgi:hypothetical protein
MSRSFNISRGDRTTIQVTLRELDGTARDLTGCSVLLRYSDGTTDYEKNATVAVPATSGVVEYEFLDGETDIASGSYPLEWIVTDAGGRERAHPGDKDFDYLVIRDRL